MDTKLLSIKSNSSQVDLKSIPEACEGTTTVVHILYNRTRQARTYGDCV